MKLYNWWEMGDKIRQAPRDTNYVQNLINRKINLTRACAETHGSAWDEAVLEGSFVLLSTVLLQPPPPCHCSFALVKMLLSSWRALLVASQLTGFALADLPLTSAQSCADGCNIVLSYLTFDDPNPPEVYNYYHTVCAVPLFIQSLYYCVDTYCAPNVIQTGLDKLNHTCLTYAAPGDVLPSYASVMDSVSADTLAAVATISSTGNFTELLEVPTIPDREYFEIGYNTSLQLLPRLQLHVSGNDQLAGTNGRTDKQQMGTDWLLGSSAAHRYDQSFLRIHRIPWKKRGELHPSTVLHGSWSCYACARVDPATSRAASHVREALPRSYRLVHDPAKIGDCAARLVRHSQLRVLLSGLPSIFGQSIVSTQFRKLSLQEMSD
nr:hypothetical protein CFP56_00341 [Quercus suber]